jgi:hypothetical protein
MESMTSRDSGSAPKFTMPQGVALQDCEKVATPIVFLANDTEMLRIDENAFFVRGKKVPQDPFEGRRVYNAFKRWLKEVR